MPSNMICHVKVIMLLWGELGLNFKGKAHIVCTLISIKSWKAIQGRQTQ